MEDSITPPHMNRAVRQFVGGLAVKSIITNLIPSAMSVDCISIAMFAWQTKKKTVDREMN